MKKLAAKAALIAATSATLLGAPATYAAADSHPYCKHADDYKTGVNYSIYWHYSSSKSYFVWNGAGYDHWHAYYVTEHYFTQPVDPAPHWTYKNCHGK